MVWFTAILLFLAAYLIGAIPFGYLIAQSKGIDLFQVGSGNIGASNVGRVLGRKYGILVFVLDLLKGAVPVALVPVVLRWLPAETETALQPVDALRVGVALAAFLGHLFPVYLRFRGGKGVATGAGTVFVLMPGPAGIALILWLATTSSTRIISLGSIVAAISLCIARVLSSPFSEEGLILTGFCFAAASIVILKHRANLLRLRQGTENRIEARPMIDFLHRSFHLLALGLWLGSAVFFNLIAAPTMNHSFGEVATADPPGDRTAYFSINTGLDSDQKKRLGSALFGAAVGPIFPIFFVLQAICGAAALITALGWWRSPGKVNRWRVYLTGAALATVAIGWLISQRVAQLRLAALTDPMAKADFVTWHLYSLGLSLITLLLVFAAMLLAARLPSSDSK
ncbi:MAG: glycerol-3-phosphate 1-O-acyltransferase PlsY [Planctomycetes bacterium]|nr:glycerol-3-phosphate 1-O-acyltransferase PlsY [Planctomycetota bacterium]